jgi:hypothetical protein
MAGILTDMIKRLTTATFGVLLLAACTAASDAPPPQSAPVHPAPISPAPDPSYPGEATKILSQTDAQRLLHNKGLTLQWIDWNTRGTAVVSPRDGLWQLRGAQSAASGKGRLLLDGAILEIGEGYFTFRGRVRITDTPDPERVCELDKTWHFAVTQGRPYYRLREFEWCDGLTDYIDIYF